MQTLHRMRYRLVGEHTALINWIRAILLEGGHSVAQGRRKLEQYLTASPEADSDSPLSSRLRQLIDDIRAKWLEFDWRIAALHAEFAANARDDADARGLATLPGIGILNATALIAASRNAQSFARARDVTAWLGLGWCRVRRPRVESRA